MKKIVAGIIVGMMFQGWLQAAHPDGASYTHIGDDSLGALLRPGPQKHHEDNDDDSLLSFGGHHDADLGFAHESSQRGSRTSFSGTGGLPVNPLPHVGTMDDGGGFGNDPVISRKDRSAITGVAKGQRRSFWDRFLRRNKQPLQPEVADETFKSDINSQLSEVSNEVSQMDPAGLRFLDAGLKRKLDTLDIKLKSFEGKIKELLRNQPFSAKQRKQVAQFLEKVRGLKNQMQRAVDQTQERFNSPAGKKRLEKLAQNQEVVDAVIKNGNTSAMKLLMFHDAKVTEAELDLALSNQRYEIFKLMENFTEGENVHPSPKVVAHLLEVSLRNADAEGVKLALDLSDTVADSKIQQYIKDIDEQIKALQGKPKEDDTQEFRPERVENESDESLEARKQLDDNVITSKKQRIKALEGIKELLQESENKLAAKRSSVGVQQITDDDSLR